MLHQIILAGTLSITKYNTNLELLCCRKIAHPFIKRFKLLFDYLKYQVYVNIKDWEF